MVSARSGTLAVGTRLGAYRVERFVAAGGMGAVYEARHVTIDRRVALKLVEGADGGWVAREALACRVRHPHVVEVIDAGTFDDSAYLVMELLEGEPLSLRLAREAPLPPDEALAVMLPIVDAVASAHRVGVCHRDLKPQNVFLAVQAGRVVPKLMDFGLSALVHARPPVGTDAATTLEGTPHYLAPEQAHGRGPVDERADQYALGVVLYECLAGALPYRDAPNVMQLLHAIARGKLVPLTTARPDLDARLARVIHRALHREPDARFGSVRAFGAALLPFVGVATRACHAHRFEPAPSACSGLDDDRVPVTLGVDGARSARVERSKLWPALLAGAAAVVGVSGYRLLPAAAPSVGSATPAVDPPLAVSVRVEPAHAEVELDGHARGTGALHVELPRDGAVHRLRVFAHGFEPQVVTFLDEPPPAVIRLVPSPAAEPPGSAPR